MGAQRLPGQPDPKAQRDPEQEQLPTVPNTVKLDLLAELTRNLKLALDHNSLNLEEVMVAAVVDSLVAPLEVASNKRALCWNNGGETRNTLRCITKKKKNKEEKKKKKKKKKKKS